jgi:hypothetical protein
MAEAPQGSWSQIWPSAVPDTHQRQEAIQRLAEGATSLRREPNLCCVAGNHIEAAAHPFRGRKSRRRVKRGPNSRVDLRSDYSAAQTEQRI